MRGINEPMVMDSLWAALVIYISVRHQSRPRPTPPAMVMRSATLVRSISDDAVSDVFQSVMSSLEVEVVFGGTVDLWMDGPGDVRSLQQVSRASSSLFACSL